MASVAKIGADDTFAQGLGGGARARPSHTDLKPVDDSRKKAGAAGDAGPSFEHRRALRAAHHVHPSVRADRHEAASSTMKIIAIPDTMARAQRSRPWLEPRRRRPHAGRVRRGTLVRDLRCRSAGVTVVAPVRLPRRLRGAQRQAQSCPRLARAIPPRLRSAVSLVYMCRSTALSKSPPRSAAGGSPSGGRMFARIWILGGQNKLTVSFFNCLKRLF